MKIITIWKGTRQVNTNVHNLKKEDWDELLKPTPWDYIIADDNNIGL